jgi:hypothetical protein
MYLWLKNLGVKPTETEEEEDLMPQPLVLPHLTPK